MRGENGRIRLLVFNIYIYIYNCPVQFGWPYFFTKMELEVTEFNRPYQIFSPIWMGFYSFLRVHDQASIICFTKNWFFLIG